EHFAYEGCHKIYLIENQNDFEDARSSGYSIYPICQLEQTYEDSCDLRFISNWGLSKQYVRQFQPAIFEK
ncbi:MAG: hypothetical protein EBR82_76905, partial [Caulobacteraceae bacterium]|nr:hypothetical protein [Caulobacteraceae bacterium]